jgi:glycosyltransferase involved in cell wall biosynthesis
VQARQPEQCARLTPNPAKDTLRDTKYLAKDTKHPSQHHNEVPSRMAHIVFFTPYYPPEVGAPQTRISETATRLVKSGHQVTVLTTLPSYSLGGVPPEYQHGARRREVLDGVGVVRVWSYITPNKGFLHRILSQLSFGCLAPFLGGKAIGRPDLLIVESPPLFDAIGGRLLAWWKRCPYVLTVADIWPEAAVQLGVLRNRLLIRLAEWLELSSYRRAAAIWSVTKGTYQLLLARVRPAQKVFLVPNGVDTALFCPLPQDEARAQLGWEKGRFIVLHAGTVALAHGLTTLLDAAEHLRDSPAVQIVILGEGTAKERLVAEAQQRNLTNVVFLPAQPHERLPVYLAAADACLASVINVPLFAGTVPVKAYEAMSCARPLLLAADGESRQMIAEGAEAALYVEPGDSQALAQAILHLAAHPQLAWQLGQRGRAFVKAHFDRNQLVKTLEERLLTLIKQPQEAPHQPLPVLQGTSTSDGSGEEAPVSEAHL